jgi:hypothetical protein
MATNIWLAVSTLGAPTAGGHRWVYLNWALGLRAAGCTVFWLEEVNSSEPETTLATNLDALKSHLEPYGLSESIALCDERGRSAGRGSTNSCFDLEAAPEADLLLNFVYELPAAVVGRFRRSALIDIDPGLTQIWISEGQLTPASHDVYFSIGETVGQPGARFPDCGLRWQYTPPAIFLPAWPATPACAAAPYTTVTNWWQGWVHMQGQSYSNTKRDGFLPFLDLPRRTTVPLEVAISYAEDDHAMLEDAGWRVRDALTVASTPWAYQSYIQASRGEFSCAKPSGIRLRNAWVSDRTLCYLASGKPAVVQHTGRSRFLPDAAGLFRFRTLAEAAHCLETAAADYERHCALARVLAEDHFDAQKVARCVLELALT